MDCLHAAAKATEAAAPKATKAATAAPGRNEVMQLIACAERKPLRHRLNALAVTHLLADFVGEVPRTAYGSFAGS